MIRHVALFRWVEGTTPEEVAAVRAALDRMPVEVPTIRDYQHGPDLVLGPERWDYAVIGVFDDAAGYQAYVDHPAHQAVAQERIAPIRLERAHVQFEI